MDKKVKNALVCMLNREEIISSWGITSDALKAASKLVNS